jgi:uncharacterized membrane protein
MSATISPRALALLLPLALVAGLHCGDVLEDQACPEGGTDLTYENFGQAFFTVHCSECHAAVIMDRQGAPPAYVFDTHEQITAHMDRIFVRSAGDNASMPPGPDDPPEEERAALAEWLACGAP